MISREVVTSFICIVIAVQDLVYIQNDLQYYRDVHNHLKVYSFVT